MAIIIMSFFVCVLLFAIPYEILSKVGVQLLYNMGKDES